jgi:hypothetical protein
MSSSFTLATACSPWSVKIEPVGQVSVDNVDSGRQRWMSLIGSSLRPLVAGRQGAWGNLKLVARNA